MAVQSTQNSKQGDEHPPNTPQTRIEHHPAPGDEARAENAPRPWEETDSNADYTDESPELLRWRADVLLDEMMLGAVDSSANGAYTNPTPDNGLSGNGSAHSGAGPTTNATAADERRHQPPSNSVADAQHQSTRYADEAPHDGANGAYPNGTYADEPDHQANRNRRASPAEDARHASDSSNHAANEWSIGGTNGTNQDENGYSAHPTHGYPDSDYPDYTAQGYTAQSARDQAANQHRQQAAPRMNPSVDYSDHPAEAQTQSDDLLQPPSALQSRRPWQTPESAPPPPPGKGPRGDASTPPHATDSARDDAQVNHASSTYAPPADQARPHQPPRAYDEAPSQARYVDQYGSRSQTWPQEQTPRAAEPPPLRPAAQPYTPARAPDPQQWSIVTGRSNDYPASVPRSADSTYRNVEAYRTAETYGNNAYGYNAEGYNGGYDNYAAQSPPYSGAPPGYAEPSTMPFADTMAVGAQAQKRSNMLPRRSKPNIEQLRQEIVVLQERIESTLPLGQDTVERARRLLEKGSAILAQDVDRAVEVSYYIQQVRSILQRAEQRIRWSNAYRQRLVIYLGSWLLLALVIFTSGYLYGEELRIFLVEWMRVAPDGLLLENFAGFYLTVGAGALGSALGALTNMWRYNRKDYGFFDRKYGLLGIMLPIIGVVVGALLYVLFAAVYYLFRISPSAMPILGMLPALLAFLFGCSQEKIYGTSD